MDCFFMHMYGHTMELLFQEGFLGRTGLKMESVGITDIFSSSFGPNWDMLS